jgi:hypothetical protein
MTAQYEPSPTAGLHLHLLNGPRNRQTTPEVERRIAIYAERAARGLPLFTGFERRKGHDDE